MMMRIVGLVAMVAMAAAVGCGGSTGGGGGNGGDASGDGGSGATSHNTSSGTMTSSSSYECCINQDRFSCPTQAAVDQCANFANPDPSACTQLSTPCGSSSSTSTSSSSGTVTKKDVGAQCIDNSECLGDACLYASGADVGLCSKVCDSFADCPSFWDCGPIDNGTANYCIPPSN